jgi:hypothetical protein
MFQHLHPRALQSYSNFRTHGYLQVPETVHGPLVRKHLPIKGTGFQLSAQRDS